LTLSTSHSGRDDSDWISQAEAARLRGVSRQAISKMIRAGRLRSFEFGGHVLVSRLEVMELRRGPETTPIDRPDEAGLFISAFDKARPEVRTEVLRRLREKYPIHPFESRMGASAEVILEALDRSGPLTIRGLRGVLAESAFDVNVVNRLEGWRSLPTPKDPPYDFLLDDGHGPIKVQVKLQRSKLGRPMMANEGYRRFSPEMYLVEPERTREGKKKSGEDTRPYRFGDFDILAVAMQASTQDWKHFFYTVSDWLMPRPNDDRLILRYQPISLYCNEDWTDDFLTSVSWFRSGTKKTIAGQISRPSDTDEKA
jgi:excisionase family DNA binding protein